VPARLAAQAILVAYAVNTLVKVGFTRIRGSRAQFARVAWPLGARAPLAVAWVAGVGWLVARGVVPSRRAGRSREVRAAMPARRDGGGEAEVAGPE
jgi:hypothetical protein